MITLITKNSSVFRVGSPHRGRLPGGTTTTFIAVPPVFKGLPLRQAPKRPAAPVVNRADSKE